MEINRGLSELLDLLRALDALRYRFVSVTPATHARVAGRRAVARDLRDLFGWSLPFREDTVPPDMLRLLDAAGELERNGDLLRSRIRVASCGDRLFVHSAFPTVASDSVFFGPDSYRFVRFLLGEAERLGQVERIVDLGCGSGIGGIMLAGRFPEARLTLIDSNEKALRYAAVNAAYAGVEAELLQGDGLDAMAGSPAAGDGPDLIVANPPYMIDPDGPAYRHGGDAHGAALSACWARAAAKRLALGGRMLLYTGSAIVGGEDALRARLVEDAPRLGCTLRYEEIDPDVFGEQLDEPAYADVERIAAVGAILERRG